MPSQQLQEVSILHKFPGRATFGTVSDLKLAGYDIWDSRLYYNIYTCQLSDLGSVGFSLPPSTNPGTTDGTVLLYQIVGDSSATGSTIAYLTAIWLGLQNTFATGACTNENLLDVHDTPTTDRPAYDYVSPSNPCANIYKTCGDEIVMVRNVMDSNYEECLSYFSKGQANVMRRYLTAYNFPRKSLTSSPALPSTCGVYDCRNKSCGDDGCGGVCGFCSSEQTCSLGLCMSNSFNRACSSAQSIVPTGGDGLKLVGDLKDANTPYNDCGTLPDQTHLSTNLQQETRHSLVDMLFGTPSLLLPMAHSLSILLGPLPV